LIEARRAARKALLRIAPDAPMATLASFSQSIMTLITATARQAIPQTLPASSLY
jgi:hypothetical protein